MTQTQIYYDDIELDLPDSEVIPITKQVNEIGDLNVFKSDFSQEFRIERTRAMNKVFENAGLIRSESLLPYQALDVKVTSQGMEVLPVAKLSLNRADNEYFYCTVFAGVKPLFQSLSKKLLSGLDLTDLEHTWNTATAVASLIADLDYQYLLFDGSDDGELIGFVSADPDRLEFQTETLRPFVKVKRLLNDIFSTIVAPNPVAYWSFDEAAGTTAYDNSGNGNDGTLVGGVTRVTGISGNALSFPGGTGHRVEIADNAGLRITGSMTLCAWVIWDGSATAGDNIMGKLGNAGFRGYFLSILPSNSTLSFGVASDADTVITHASTTTVSTGEWVFLAGVYNAVAQTMDVYINGTLAATTKTTGVPASQYSNNGSGVAIGDRSTSVLRTFPGLIDEPRIYSRALTQQEITGLYNNPNGKNNTVTFPADTLLDKMFLSIDNIKIDGTKAYNLSYETIGTDNFSYNTAIELRTRISDPFGLVVSSTFTAPQSGTYSVVFLFSNQTDATSIDVAIDGLNSASISKTGREAVGSFLAERGDEITFFYDIEDYLAALDPSDEVDPIYPESLYFAVTGFKQSFDFGLPVAVAPFLPEITHGEFLKAICKLFGLVPSYDSLTDQVELWSLSSVLTNKRIAKNWSAYMDYSDTQINFRLDYAQINRMQYKEDEDVNEGNGDSSIQVNDENLELEKDLFKLPFSFAESVTKTTSGSPVLSDEMARIAWYETIEDSVEYNEKTSIAARLVTREDMTLTTRIGATDLTAAQSKKALGLRLENVLPYYEALTTMLTSTKILVQKFNLPATEIAALDHSVPVYLDYYNSYFFVKRVRNWIDGELCNVELIRI